MAPPSTSAAAPDGHKFQPPVLEQTPGTQASSTAGSISDGDKEDLEKPGASVATKWSVFDDDVLGKHYIPPTTWESAHRFDATATWTEAEEKAVIRKCDWKVTVLTCIMFCALQLDRGNIANAVSDNMLPDLGLTTTDFNLGNTIFTVSFLFAELPSQLISKKVGVDRWVPFQICAWSLVAMFQCLLTGKTGFFITRALLGLIEGGFIPDMVLYLTYFFTGPELAIRLTWFWVSLTLTTIFGAFLASGLLLLRGMGPHAWEGWRYLFVVEGGMTLLVGLYAAAILPASPTQTAGYFRGAKGWFTEREETIIVNRILRDDPSKSDMHNRQAISASGLWHSIKDYDMWPIYLIGLTFLTSTSTIATYFTLTLRSLGFSTFNTNLLTIPGNVLKIFNEFGITYLTMYTGEKALTASLGNWYQLPLFIAVVLLPASTGAWTKYGVLLLLIGAPYAHPINVAWTSQNAGGVRSRSVSASLYNISVQISSIISANIYQARDKPLYRVGNRVLLGILVFNLFTWMFAKVYYVKRNAWKAAQWDAFTIEEKDDYLATTTDLGNKRLDFRFVH